MKLRAIRAREAGGFGDAVALEGLSGGLDVLAGPNELGKSTILHVLRALFFERHSSTATKGIKGAVLAKLKRDGGGAPLLEADFELGGKSWRLRKQFLSGKLAVLSDLDAGTVVARGDDADEQARELLQGWPGLEDRLGLLWVGQQQALKAVAPGQGDVATLRGLVEAQVLDVAVGGHGRVVLGEVKKRLDGMRTKNGPKKHSAYYKAVEAQENIAADLKRAQEKAALAQERTSRLQELLAQEKELSGREAVGLREAALKDAKSAHGAALKARETVRNAALVLDKCRAEQEPAVKAHDEFAGRLGLLADLQDALKAAAPIGQELEQKLHAGEEVLRGAKKQQQQKRLALDDLRQKLKDATAHHRQQEARQRLAKLQGTIEQARQAEADIKSARQDLASSGVTAGRVKKARQLAGEMQSIAARLSAAAPKLSVAYAKGVRDKILIAGKPVVDGTRIDVQRPLVLEITGIGTITVAPGGSSDADDDRADADAMDRDFKALLGAMDVADLNAAEAALEARGLTETRLSKAEAQLSALAPGGIDVITLEAAQLQLLAGDSSLGGLPLGDPSLGDPSLGDPSLGDPSLGDPSLGDPSLGDPSHSQRALDQRVAEDESQLEIASVEDLAEKVAALEARLTKLEPEVDELAQAASRASAELVKHNATTKAQTERRDELEKDIPGMAERESELARLAKAVAAAERAVSAATRDLADWQEKAGDEASFKALEKMLTDAETATQTAQRALTKIRLETKEIEGALTAFAQDGVETRVAELHGKLAAARAGVAGFRDEVDALELLANVLAKAEAATRDRFLAPVVARIAPYLDLVLPGAVLDLGDGLKVAGLTRGSVSEPVSVLSDGTREQLAVLVRLGFAKLLAEAGTTVPLILDDALVYSDDDRIARGFEALQMAAKLHQVIVLTCRTASFERLGGHRLELTPWTPADTEV